MRRLLLLLVVCAAPSALLAEANDDGRVPMPADVPPHSADYPAGPHHFDISGNDHEIHHFGDHWISYGGHNYDMKEDPSNRARVDYENKRYRGIEPEHRQRWHMHRRSLEEVHFASIPEQPWVVDRIRRRGLDYEMPPDEEHDEMHRRAVGFPRPSWYAIYKKRKRVVRE